jgi:hypothetical protein
MDKLCPVPGRSALPLRSDGSAGGTEPSAIGVVSFPRTRRRAPVRLPWNCLWRSWHLATGGRFGRACRVRGRNRRAHAIRQGSPPFRKISDFKAHQINEGSNYSYKYSRFQKKLYQLLKTKNSIFSKTCVNIKVKTLFQYKTFDIFDSMSQVSTHQKSIFSILQNKYNFRKKKMYFLSLKYSKSVASIPPCFI